MCTVVYVAMYFSKNNNGLKARKNQFIGNVANEGGAVYFYYDNTKALFEDCLFQGTFCLCFECFLNCRHQVFLICVLVQWF